MNISVREFKETDIPLIVDYFINANKEFLKGMGADKSKLPSRDLWIQKLRSDYQQPHSQKEFYYIIWLMNDQPIGHSNINQIQFGKLATMHLHLWKPTLRKSGLGMEYLQQTIPYFFKNFKLQKLICEPYAKNPAPNRVLHKMGFNFIKAYETTPGWINFKQIVNRYEMSRSTYKHLWTV